MELQKIINEGKEDVTKKTEIERVSNGTDKKEMKYELSKGNDQGTEAKSVTVTEKKVTTDKADKNKAQARAGTES